MGATILAMTGQISLALTVASACLVKWGYLTEYAAASSLTRLSAGRPLASLRRRERVGVASAIGGLGLLGVSLAGGAHVALATALIVFRLRAPSVADT